MRVFFLELLEELHLTEHIARVGLPEDFGELDRGEPVARVLAVFVRNLGDGELVRLRSAQRQRRSLGPALLRLLPFLFLCHVAPPP
ncbi:hypothetical protein SDC9_78870 [bioreactor metagenome]|uniref:Uncharacterized protein n=1 Tax=bioreactor metagenome TaxID=1076179 RepID=A0A644YWB4_9ZZZZ